MLNNTNHHINYAQDNDEKHFLCRQTNYQLNYSVLFRVIRLSVYLQKLIKNSDQRKFDYLALFENFIFIN